MSAYPRLPLAISCALACTVACTVACGGGGYAAGTFQDAEATYHVGSPGPAWRRVAVEGQNDLAWTHDRPAAVIQVNASCGQDLDIPLRALTNHLLIGFTEREIQSQTLVPVARREALRTHLGAKLDGVPREIVLHVLKKEGCVYDFALVAGPGASFVRVRGAYERIVASFRTGGTG